MKEFLKKLITFRFSGKCPDMDVLAAYHEGGLGPELEQGLEAHLCRCHKCRVLFATDGLSRTSGENVERMPFELAERLTERLFPARDTEIVELVYIAAKDLLEQVSPSGKLHVMQPAFFRQEAASQAYCVTMGEHQIEVSTSCLKNSKYEIWLRVADKGNEELRYEWQIWAGPELLEHQPAVNGEALFDEVSLGEYRCLLLVSGKEIGAIQLTLTEKG